MFRHLGHYWNVSMNMKFMPALVQRALQGQSISDFYIYHVNVFSDLFVGGPNWNHRMPELIMTIGEKAKIDAGDCLCIWMGAFPFTGWLNTSGRFQGSHPWKLIDFKK